MSDALAALRDHARSTYLSVLLAPANKRDDLVALASFLLELARVPAIVSEPATGEIRLQWWAEVARGLRDEEGRGHPVGAELLRMIESHNLPREPLAAIAEARSFDLYSDAVPDREALETYAGEVGSVPLQMACRILDPDAARGSATAAGHLGVFAVLTDRLATLARDRREGPIFVPEEALVANWSSPEALRGELDGEAREAAMAAIRSTIALADEHLKNGLEATRLLPRSLAPAFAPALARRPKFEAVGRAGDRTLDVVVECGPLAEQFAVSRAARAFTPGPNLLGRLREGWLGRPGPR